MRDREVEIPRQLADVGPVAKVWIVANTMRGAERKDVLAVCRKLGVNPNTAKTQFQLFQYSRRQAHVARTLPRRVRSQVKKAAAQVMA